MPKEKPVCKSCGSDDVRADAYAEWDIETQEWQLASTYDATFCEQCGDECSVEWVSAEEEDEDAA